MKRTILFGLIQFTIKFHIMRTPIKKNDLEIESIAWVSSGKEVSIAEHDEMPNLLTHFEEYLEAIMPALMNGREPEPYSGHYEFKTNADYQAALRDDYIAPPRNSAAPIYDDSIGILAVSYCGFMPY